MADLHGTILSHATSFMTCLGHILGHDCHKVLKHVLKSYNFFRVVRELESVLIIGIGTESNSDCGELEVSFWP